MLFRSASAIILEVSYIEYNEGAPSQQETLNYMKKIGFEEKISIGEHYDGEQIVQKDLLFLKLNQPIEIMIPTMAPWNDIPPFHILSISNGLSK